MLNRDGTVYTANLRKAHATDTYILKGDGEEVWEPHFTYHGFRYVQMESYGGDVDAAVEVGCAVYSALPQAGEFECSDPLVTQVWRNVLWGQKSNFVSVPTDCPQRDERLGWLGDDVWLAHGIHFDDPAITKLAAAGTGVAHCPSSNARLGAGIARTADLRAAGVPVGLGVDGAASNEACSLIEEARHALLFARARGGPQALAVRDALELATIGGARLLGWDDQVGSLEPGKQADVAVWRLDGLAHADIADPVAALVLGAAPPLELLLVGGRTVVERDRVVTVDEHELTQSAVRAHRSLLARASTVTCKEGTAS